MDDKLKNGLNKIGLNIDAMNPQKIAIDESGRNKTGKVHTDHITPVPKYVLEAENWGITQSNAVSNILLLDFDGENIPSALKKYMLTSRTKNGRESYHSIFQITDADQETCDNLAKRYTQHGGLEVFSRGKRLAFLGMYDTENTKSKWFFCGHGVNLREKLESGELPKCSEKQFRDLMRECGIGQYESNPISKHTNKVNTEQILEKGSRDNGIYQIACSVIRTSPKLSQDAILSIMQDKNRKQCKPPLSDDDVKTKVNSAWNFIKSQKKTDKVENNQKNQEKRMELIQELMTENNFIRIRGDKDRRLYLMENRVYKEFGDDDLAKMIIDRWPDRSKEDRNYIIEYIKDLNFAKIEEFDVDHDILNCENCFVSLSEQKEVELDNYKSLKQFPVEYKPELGTDKDLENLYKQILPNDWQDRLMRIGMAFGRTTINPEKLFFDIGDGSNGKSTLYHIEETIFGDNCTAVSPQELADDMFASIELEGKYAVICHDISEQNIKDITTFKRLGSREKISGQRKYGHRREFTPECVSQFACNQFPDIRLQYYDAKRIHITVYGEKFEPNDENTKDEYWKSFVDTPEKRSKALNLYLKYYKMAVERKGKMINYQTPEKTMLLWNNSVNSVELYIDERLERSKTKNIITKKELFEDYVKWCANKINPETNEKFTPETSSVFSRALSGRDFEYKTVRIIKEPTPCWTNLKYRENSNITQLSQ